jgi:hypothetical protein
MTTTEAADLRAAREHAALLRDLEALCRKYIPRNPVLPLPPDAKMPTKPGQIWVIPDEQFQVINTIVGIPDDPAAAGITYIAGPMTGYPDHNWPAFNAMAARLRGAGLTVINPAELHPDTTHDWDWYLRRDIAELVKCSRVVFLPDWFNSRGARLEHHVAAALGLDLVYPDDIDDFITNRTCAQ